MLIPDRIFPLVLNPTVESTVIIDDPIDIFSTDFVLGVILKLPSTSDASE